MFNFILKSKASLAVIGLAIAIASSATAAEVQFTGFTQGRFNANAFANTDSLFNLVYTSSTFDNTTVGGQLDLGGNPTPGTDFNNLGSFTLGAQDQNYNGNTFELMVTFTAPATIVGGTSTIFTDLLIGSVLNGVGGVFIDFDNTVQT
ncbi:MAG: hypothetical protein H7Y17_05750, partial [Chlorobia bacterium]|nr:hypothetical protein [Fimbriimonadaceae bacterium]